MNVPGHVFDAEVRVKGGFIVDMALSKGGRNARPVSVVRSSGR